MAEHGCLHFANHRSVASSGYRSDRNRLVRQHMIISVEMADHYLSGSPLELRFTNPHLLLRVRVAREKYTFSEPRSM